jgi:hypothetical protein
MDLSCPNCGRALHITEEHIGKQIRCPACLQISVAAAMAENLPSTDAMAESKANPSATSWQVRAPDGPIYGPIGWDELLAWAAEGRIGPDAELSEAGEAKWRPATELIANLPGSGPSDASGVASASAPYAQPAAGYPLPHRGLLVLIMGLMGLMSCPLFSIAAWVIGSRDLWQMRSGRMDRSGEGLTLAGMVLGILVTVGWILVALAVSVMVLIYVAAHL